VCKINSHEQHLQPTPQAHQKSMFPASCDKELAQDRVV